MEWDVGKWESLVAERGLRDWVTPDPGLEDVARCREITQRDMLRLEEAWKINPDLDLEDLDGLDELQLTFVFVERCFATLGACVDGPFPHGASKVELVPLQCCLLCRLEGAKRPLPVDLLAPDLRLELARGGDLDAPKA